METRVPDDVVAEFKEFAMLKAQMDRLAARQSAIKKALMSYLEENGYEDGDGHRYADLPGEIGGYLSIQRQRRVSQKTDEDAASRILTSKGLAGRCYRMVPVLDEDEILGAFYQGEITQEELDEMYPKSITYAFVPRKSR